MRYFSLFSGIGGFEYGIEKANDTVTERIQQGEGQRSKRNTTVVKSLMGTQQFHCIGCSEIDKYAKAIYRFHYPKHRNYGDATRIIPEELPDFDLLCAGFPCQAFSIAGKRKGFDDTRGTLFFEICKIARTKRPDYLLLENVRGLLSHDEGRTFLVILQSLDELGYNLQWQVLNSKDWGVPQNRERVFIIGNLRGKPRPEVFPIRESIKISKKGRRKRKVANQLSSTITENLKRGIHSGGETLIKIGNIDKLGHNSIWGRVYDLKGLTSSINAEGGGLGAKTGLYEIGNKIRRLTPIECERLQGFPDNWTKWGIMDSKKVKISDTQRYCCLGNAVTTNVITAIMERWGI